MSKRWRWRFGGLYWRVTASYFLVTLVAALIIEASFTAGPLIQEFLRSGPKVPLAQMLEEQEAPQIAPYLEQTTPDQAALHVWILPPLVERVDAYVKDRPAFVAIVDRAGQVVAAVACASSNLSATRSAQCPNAEASQIAETLAPPPVQAALQTALAGESQPTSLKGSDAPQQTITAASIRSYAGQILGAIVVVFADVVSTGGSGPSLGHLFSIFLYNLQPAGFYFLLLATAIGTLTGLLISSGITRRLRRITQAAASWSRGEFQVAVSDRSHDEVGQLARDLNRMAEQVQALLATRQELAVVEERNRLARELHDSVKQHVFANALLVRAARKLVNRDTARAQDYLAEAEELASQTQQELIALIRALRPAAIADKGLVAVLQEYTADWSRRMGIAVNLRVQGERATPLDIEETLFRVAQESLTNVARHSQAQQVEVTLVWEAGQLRLTVQDDGRGFDLSRAEWKGIGLASMRERVEAVQGTFTISSSASGTSIAVSVPLVLSRAPIKTSQPA